MRQSCSPRHFRWFLSKALQLGPSGSQPTDSTHLPAIPHHFDDAFSTVPSLTTVAERDHRFEQLFQYSRECYLDSADVSSSPTPLDDHWLSPSDLTQRDRERHLDLLGSTPCLRPPSASVPEPVPEGVLPVPPASDMDPPLAPEGVSPTTPPALPQAPEGVPPDTSVSVPSVASDLDDTSGVPVQDPLPPPAPDGPPVSRRFPSRDRGGTWKDGPALDRWYTHGQWKTGFTCLLSLPQYALSIASSWGQPPPAVANMGRLSSPRHGTTRIRHAHIADLALLQGDWSGFGSTISTGFPSIFSAYLQPDLSDDPGSFTVTDVQPHILAAKSATNTANSPTYGQAINSPHAEKWWEAMETELTTLESDLQAWELVPHEPWMHVHPSTWAFRLKRFPNGLAKKFKARFCIRGDRQVEGVDFFETWAPVVQ